MTPSTEPIADNKRGFAPAMRSASLNQRILSINEEELSRIILDVHDGPVQYIYTALSLLTGVRQEIDAAIPGSDLAPRLAHVGTLLESSLYEIKTFMGTFRPPEFRSRSLVSILEGLIIQHEEWTHTTVGFEKDTIPDEIPLAVKIALYRVLQEALSNGYRHAGIEQQWVRLWAEDGYICLEVEDAGCGFEPPDLTASLDEHAEHIGLRGMADRMSLLSGSIEIDSKPGQGARIIVKAPLCGNVSDG